MDETESPVGLGLLGGESVQSGGTLCLARAERRRAVSGCPRVSLKGPASAHPRGICAPQHTPGGSVRFSLSGSQGVLSPALSQAAGLLPGFLKALSLVWGTLEHLAAWCPSWWKS